jgi:hypothetical protein
MTCTPLTGTFPGDYFEQRWDAMAGREWGHYVRVHRGPTAAPTPGAVAGYIAELQAIAKRVGIMREPGDDADVEAPDAVPF